MAANTAVAALRAGPLGKVVATSARPVGDGDRGADALQQPGDDQRGLVPGHAAQDRGDGEQRDADDEGAFAADGVTEPSAQQHQTAEGQDIRGDDPAAARIGQAQLVLDLRKRDDRDRAVHGCQQLHAADRDDRGDEAARGQPLGDLLVLTTAEGFSCSGSARSVPP